MPTLDYLQYIYVTLILKGDTAVYTYQQSHLLRI